MSTPDRSKALDHVVEVYSQIMRGYTINDVHHHTSVIRTLRERWDLGDPLTQRDADAPDLAPLLTRHTARPPPEWPDVHPQPVPDFDEALVPLDKPLSPLAKAVVGGGAALARNLDPTAPDIPDVDQLDGAHALAALRATVGHLFPLLQTHREAP